MRRRLESWEGGKEGAGLGCWLIVDVVVAYSFDSVCVHLLYGLLGGD